MEVKRLDKRITIDHLFAKDEYERGETLEGSMATVHMILKYITTGKNAMVDNPELVWDLRAIRFIKDDPTLIEAEMGKLRNNLAQMFPRDNIEVDAVRRSNSAIMDIVFTVNNEIVGSIATDRLERNYNDWLSLSSLK